MPIVIKACQPKAPTQKNKDISLDSDSEEEEQELDNILNAKATEHD